MPKGERLEVIDFAKGALMVLVIIGHVIPWPAQWLPARQWIYFFHMPLFFGISGWLMNPSKLYSESWGGFLSRMFNRLLLPWLIAAAFFFTMVLISKSPSKIPYEALRLLIHPWFHLWFVPAFFGMMVITKIFLQLNQSPSRIFAISTSISLVWLLLNKDNLYGDGITKIFGDKRIILMWPFFCGGFMARLYLKNAPAKISHSLGGIAILLIGIFFIANGLSIQSGLRDVLWIVTNLAIILLGGMVFVGSDRGIKYNPVVVWIGKNSLPIYLWHVLAIQVAGKIISPANHIYLFWCLALSGVACLLIVIRFIEQVKLPKAQIFFQAVLLGKS